jgi:hypothetical protein
MPGLMDILGQSQTPYNGENNQVATPESVPQPNNDMNNIMQMLAMSQQGGGQPNQGQPMPQQAQQIQQVDPVEEILYNKGKRFKGIPKSIFDLMDEPVKQSVALASDGLMFDLASKLEKNKGYLSAREKGDHVGAKRIIDKYLELYKLIPDEKADNKVEEL